MRLTWGWICVLVGSLQEASTSHLCQHQVWEGSTFSHPCSPSASAVLLPQRMPASTSSCNYAPWNDTFYRDTLYLKKKKKMVNVLRTWYLTFYYTETVSTSGKLPRHAIPISLFARLIYLNLLQDDLTSCSRGWESRHQLLVCKCILRPG